MLKSKFSRVGSSVLVAGFALVDVNPNYFNCGHYPEWEVTAIQVELRRWNSQIHFVDRTEAEEEAAARNHRSKARWHEFLNC